MKIFLTLLCALSFHVALSQVNFIGYNPTVNGQSPVLINVMAPDTAGNIWIVGWCTSCSGTPFYLYYFDGSTWSIADSNQSIWGGVYSMFFDENNYLWIERGNLLIKWHNGVIVNQYSNSPYLGGRHLDKIQMDGNGNIWGNAGFPGPLLNTYVKFDGTSWTVFDSSQVGLNPNEPSYFFTIDTNNIFYATSDSTGLHKYDGTSWSVINSTNSNLAQGVRLRAIVHDSQNNLWILGYNSQNQAHFYKYDGTSFTAYVTSSIPYYINSSYLVIDKDDNLWCVGGNNVIKFNGSFITMFPLDSGANFGGLGYFEIDKKNTRLWLSAINGVGKVCSFNEAGYQTISGKVFNDANQNALMDAGENPLQGGIIYSSASAYTLTNSTGFYHLAYTDSNSAITIGHVLKPWSVQTTLPLLYSVTPAVDTTCCYGFGAYQYPNINEVNIYGAIPNARPGFQTVAQLYYSNQGTTVLSDTILVVHDSLLQFSNSSVTPVFQSGDTIMFSYSNLAPQQNGFIQIYFNVPVTAVLGDTANCTATIYPVASDTIPGNNFTDMSLIVGGSYDPNEKKVSPPGNGPAGDIAGNQRLTYQINFQNTGTDTAFTVVIVDTLSDFFDISTFQLVAFSNPVVTQLNNKILKFTFPNILLPDSNINEPASHGYVRFSILPKTTLTYGTQLVNDATILFDFNAGVVTNSTLNTITSPVSVLSNHSTSYVAIFPNPADNYINVRFNSGGIGPKQIKIIDITGRIVLAKQISESNDRINCSILENGIYLLQLKDGENISKSKFVIQKISR